MKKVFYSLVGIGLVLFVVVFSFVRKIEIFDNYPEVVTTNFVGYDLARASLAGVEDAGGEAVRIEMLMRPGVEAHEFEPSAKDIEKLYHAKVIVMNGGESEAWMERILETNTELAEKCVRMMNFVEAIQEEGTETGEVDEHVWTSPVNTLKILAQLAARLEETFPEGADRIRENSEKYGGELNEIDIEMREMVAGAARKKIVVADRFPFAYLTREYGLEYVAAFPGCAESTETNPQTLSEIITTIEEEEIPVVYKIEMSSGEVAEMVASETGARLLELQSGHSISEEEFSEGVRYVDLLRRNLGVLKEGLR